MHLFWQLRQCMYWKYSGYNLMIIIFLLCMIPKLPNPMYIGERIQQNSYLSVVGKPFIHMASMHVRSCSVVNEKYSLFSVCIITVRKSSVAVTNKPSRPNSDKLTPTQAEHHRWSLLTLCGCYMWSPYREWSHTTLDIIATQYIIYNSAFIHSQLLILRFSCYPCHLEQKWSWTQAWNVLSDTETQEQNICNIWQFIQCHRW